MKIKLLKKVRKRFSIIHLPNGYVDYNGEHHDFNLFRLDDIKSSEFRSPIYAQLMKNYLGQSFCKKIFSSEKECVNYLKTKIIAQLRSEGHRGRKDRVIQNKIKKVWYI